MFSLRLLLSLGSFRANSLWSKATLSKCGIPDICPSWPPVSSYAEEGVSASAWQDVCDSAKLSCCTFYTSQSTSVCCILQKCPVLPVTRVLHLPAPCLLITQHVPHLAGVKRTYPRLPSISEAVWNPCRVTGVNPRCHFGGWKCLPEPLQLRCSWVWSISLRGDWEMLVRSCCCWGRS